MPKAHHVIYVPGITDDVRHVQGIAVRLWGLHGLHGHMHVMPWAGPGVYDAKHQALLAHIDMLAEKGYIVSLVGASAGASAVINAYVERLGTVAKVAYVTGKINHPETVRPQIYQENPAFKASLLRLQTNLAKLTADDKARMRSFYARDDRTVPYEDTRIPGVAEERLTVLGHAWGIFSAVTIEFYRVARFLKA
ncbi:MAG TPA: hypothetical protein VLF40_03800 [Candidatus Saccharimonadales bacterium]|nr:hypothetical protein [Candidatus Saccharimonadales bacterium]